MSKRRRFTAEFKAGVVLEDVSGIKDRAELCREHRLSPQVLARWREEFLERIVGRLTMELEAAKKVSSILTSLSNRNGR